MGNIREKRGKLFFDFRHHGVRYREYTALEDTPANRKRMQKMLARIEAEITLGRFDYAATFPGSANAARFAQAQPAHAARPSAGMTPLYKAFAQTWFAENEPLWRRSHRATVLSTLERHLIPAFGEQPVGQIDKAACLAFRARLAKLPGRMGNDSLAAKTVNRIMQVHHQIMAEAGERHGFVDPTHRIKRLKQRKAQIHPFSLADVERLIETVRADYRNYLLVRFFTGLRTGEINGLQWRYVDFERRQILIRETLVRGALDYTKTDGSQRDVAMSQPVLDALQAQHAVTGQRSGFVFCNGKGEPIDLYNFTNRVWYPLLRHLALDARRPYQTRHTTATLWLGAGENPEWVARQLGHTNTEMLFKTYSRYVPNLTRSDGSAMERLLAARLPGTAETPHPASTAPLGAPSAPA